MYKPKVYLFPFPLEFKAATRRMALDATADALGENNMACMKFKHLYLFNLSRLEAQLKKATQE